MSQTKQTQSKDQMHLHHILASEARLNRLHRLFKPHYNVTEPSIILEPYLFLGNCISAHDTNRLSKLGIRYVLNVAMRDVELCPYYSSDIRTLSLDLRDDDRENILRTFEQAFPFIDDARRAKSRILVHCSHGQSRSPAIVIAYLMRTYNVSLEQCLSHVVTARPCVLPNDGFLKQLILFDRFLVDRRARREKEALMKGINDVSSKEAATQNNASVTPQSASCSMSETSNANSPSSGNSSKVRPVSTASIDSSSSNDSVHIIPIQIQSNVSNTAKVASITNQKTSASSKSPVKQSKDISQNSKGKYTIIDISIAPKLKNTDRKLSNHAALSRHRESAYIKNDTKRTSPKTARSQSAHTERTKANDSEYPSSVHHRNVINYEQINYHKPKEHTRTRYITEIYDRATNRFIPATC